MKLRALTIAMIILMAALGQIACQETGAGDTRLAEEVEDEHAGHNHPPGEHPGESDPHAGHDHGPGEHDYGNCPHDLQADSCPWCTPKLMVDLGFCRGHDTPEAFCAPCGPAVIPGLKAMNDWCAEHGQSETFCQSCRPEVSGDVCPHGVAPDYCPFCTPKNIVDKGFCNGHGVPEAFCHLCDPGVIPAFKARGDWCVEHEAPESFCPVCAPAFNKPASEGIEPEEVASAGLEILPASELPGYDDTAEVQCDTESLRVQLAPGMNERMGLTLTSVRNEALSEEHDFNAQIDYNRNRLASLSPRAPGVIVELKKQIGDPVREGEVLAVIDSVAIGNAKAELVQASALADLRDSELKRVKRLHEVGVSTESSRLAAEAAMVEANAALSRSRQALKNLGLTDAEIDRVTTSGETDSKLTLSAPFSGVVIERSASMGEVVDVSMPLFKVADTSRMWVLIDIYETELARVRQGLNVVFSPDGMQDRLFGGKVDWISSSLDPQTRTLRARAELDNRDGLLKAHMFGRARVTVREGESTLLVPKETVQWEGCCHIVFERLSDKLYAPRRVQLGHVLDNHYEIESGISEGAQVVAGGSFLLKTEIMKGSIGAGCCEIGPPA